MPRHRRTPHQWRGNRTDCGCNIDCDCAAIFGVLLLLLPVVDPQEMTVHTQRMVEDAQSLVFLMEILSLLLFAVGSTDACCCHDEVRVKLDH